MCGVVFHYAENLEPAEHTARIRRANAAIAHRGPDGAGERILGRAALGHRRLAIVDIQDSTQPMSDPSGRYWLTYNGEIYNYEEVRASLSEQWSFRTRGDTEVLLAALVTLGPAALSRLEGMWAFCLWDTEQERLLMGRDRFGKKPLYYRISGASEMAASSELSGLRALLHDQDWSEDEDSISDYFRYGFYLPGHTAYREVHEVLPAHFAWWSPGKALQQSQWWSLPESAPAGGGVDVTTKLRSAIRASVERRLVADVDVGAFLSGGVDSSTVVALASNAHPQSLKTFTIGFSDKSYDESDVAARVAANYGTEHYQDQMEAWRVGDLTSLLLHHVGQPFADSSLLPTALVSRLAATHVKVVMSGDGGDELFCGYERYHARSLLRWYTRLPDAVKRANGQLIRLLPEPFAHHSRSLLKKAQLFQDVVDRLAGEQPYIANLVFRPEDFRNLFPGHARLGYSAPGVPDQTEPDELGRMMRADALVYLPQDILLKVDRASMASSLEVRCPFLDSEVASLAFQTSAKRHRQGLQGKVLLRDASADLLIPEVQKRRKQGFGSPVNRWFRDGLAEELIARAEGVSTIDHSALRDFVNDHLAGRRDHGYRMWNIYSYLVWKDAQM